jgi:NACHT domain
MGALGPREQAEIRRFRAALTLDTGASIHLVVADTRRVLDQALAQVGVELERVRPLALASVDADEHSGQILRDFGAALDRAGGRPTVLEAIVSTPATDLAWRRVFRELNEKRNFIEQRASGPLVFCVRPELEQALGHEAPDVWSKRGSGMRLVDRTPNRVLVSYAADSPEVVAGVEEVARALTDAGLEVDRDGGSAVDAADAVESLAHSRLARADVVVCVCTPLWCARVNGEAPVGSGPGATWEARAVRHEAYALGGRSDRFVLVQLPTTALAVPTALDTEGVIHRWPEDRGRVVTVASASTVHARLRRAIERTFGDDIAAMTPWASGFLTRWESETNPEDCARELGDRLLRVRDPEAQRSALATLGLLQGDPTAMGTIAAALGLGDLPRDPRWFPLLAQTYQYVNMASHGDYLDAIARSAPTRSLVAATDAVYDPLDAFVRTSSGSRSVRANAEVAEAVAATEVAQHGVEHRSVPMLTAFEHARGLGRRALMLLGDPGAGKSTRLTQLGLEVARNGAETIGLSCGTIPVLLHLRNLRPGVDDLRDFIEQELQERGKWPSVARRHALLVMLDGLDEVVEPRQRRLVSSWVEAARRSEPGVYFLVSSRYGGYTPDLELDAAVVELHIRPLDDARARCFVTRWCADRKLAEPATGEILAALSHWRADEPQLHALTRSPLMLATICEAYVVHGALPRGRVELYEACVSVRLRGHPFATELRATLEEIAWWMHTEERTRATAAELEPVVSSAFARVGLGLEPLPWLRGLRDEHGLLLGWGIDDYGFVHPAIQQHLAARRDALGHHDPEP